jgi:hypothetical protein
MIGALTTMKEGRGGAVLLVDAVPAKPGQQFWLGFRHEPVPTAFEAVLRGVLAGTTYDRVVVATHERRDLPPWKLSASTTIGTGPLVWTVEASAPAAAPAAPTPGVFTTFNPNTLETLQERVLRPELYRGKSPWMQLDALLRLMQDEPANQRVCWVVDGRWFVPPNAPEAGAQLRQRIESRLAQGRGLDLVLVFPEGAEEGNQLLSDAGLLASDLHLKLEGERVALRPAEQPWRGLLEGAGQASLLTLLRSARLSTRPVGPRRPRHTQYVDLEFWASSPVERLEQVLRAQVIGQDQVVADIVASFTRQRSQCRRALQRGIPPQRCTSPKYLPPVIGLFGAAGMGKSHISSLVAQALFGDPAHIEELDLTDKELGPMTVGSEVKYQGGENKTQLINYCERTGGLGIVVFDEIAGISTSTARPTLADAWSKGREILQHRRFRPTNPHFEPAGQFFHVKNTVFFLAGNISAPGEDVPSGFRCLDDLGPALAQRIGEKLWFNPLPEHHFEEAALACVRLQAAEIGSTEWTEHAQLPQFLAAAANALVTGPAMAVVLAEFKKRSASVPPSHRVMRESVGSFSERLQDIVDAWFAAPEQTLVFA